MVKIQGRSYGTLSYFSKACTQPTCQECVAANYARSTTKDVIDGVVGLGPFPQVTCTWSPGGSVG